MVGTLVPMMPNQQEHSIAQIVFQKEHLNIEKDHIAMTGVSRLNDGCERMEDKESKFHGKSRKVTENVEHFNAFPWN